MKLSSTLWVLVILAALGTYVFFFERGKAPEEGGVRPLAQVLGYRTDQVRKLQLNRKLEGPLWLVQGKERGGESWRLEKPVSAAADGTETKRLLTELSDTMVDRVLTEGIDDLKPFGLDAPSWELTIVTANGKAHTLLGGGKDPSGASLYLKPKDRKEILVLPAFSLEGLQTKKAEELRDKNVSVFKKDDVQRFELTAGGKTIRVEREGADAWRLTAPVQAKARAEKVNAILTTFENLKGSRIVADAPRDLRQYGLAQPAARVAVWVRGEKEPRVALLGGKDAGGDLYAKAERNPAVMAVYSYVLNDAQATVADLKEPAKAAKQPANAPAPPGAPAPAGKR